MLVYQTQDSTVRVSFFFFNDTPTTEIYTLSLHDALPIWHRRPRRPARDPEDGPGPGRRLPADQPAARRRDRKSTRLNSSHPSISYAVFCLKKKNCLSTEGVYCSRCVHDGKKQSVQACAGI